MTSVAFSHRDYFFFCLHEKSCLVKILNPRLTAFVSVHTLVFACKADSYVASRFDAARHFEIVSLSYLKVVRVMCRRYLYCSRSLFGIRIRVSYDRNFLFPPAEVLPSLPTISLYLSSSGCTAMATSPNIVSGLDVATTIRSPPPSAARISEIPVLAVLVLVLYLRIRKRCAALRTPVYKSVSSVYKAFFVKLYEESALQPCCSPRPL